MIKPDKPHIQLGVSKRTGYPVPAGPDPEPVQPGPGPVSKILKPVQPVPGPVPKILEPEPVPVPGTRFKINFFYKK